MTTTSMQARAEVVTERAAKGARGALPTADLARLERFAEMQKEQHATRFDLLQVVAGEGHSLVQVIKADKPRDIAHEAVEWAHHDAQAFAGVTTYILAAYLDGSSTWAARCSFRIAARMGNDDLAPTEGPTAAGMTLQGMRHIEVMAFQYSEGMRSVLREKDTTIDDLRTMVDKLMAERDSLVDGQMAVVRMREELASEIGSREIALTRERASVASKEKLFGMFFAVAAPILKQKLAAWQLGAAPADVAPPVPPSPPTTTPAADVAPAAVPTVAADASPVPANDTRPRLSTQACERVVSFVTSLDEPTFKRMLEILSEDQGAKLLAIVTQLTSDAKDEAP